MLTDYSKKNSKISFCRHLSNFENWISRIFSENPEAFEERVNKLIKEKEEEKEQRRKDAERALQEVREKRAKVKQFNSMHCNISLQTFIIIVFQGLDSVVKLDLLRERTSEEIKTIWLEHHKNKSCVYGVLDVSSVYLICSLISF